jgi:hypothetical protein
MQQLVLHEITSGGNGVKQMNKVVVQGQGIAYMWDGILSMIVAYLKPKTRSVEERPVCTTITTFDGVLVRLQLTKKYPLIERHASIAICHGVDAHETDMRSAGFGGQGDELDLPEAAAHARGRAAPQPAPGSWPCVNTLAVCRPCMPACVLKCTGSET